MAIYDWGDLPPEIAAKISMHIEFYDDYEAFTTVCSGWRSAVKEFNCQYINTKHTQLPWLMLVDDGDTTYRRYYSLTKRKFLMLDHPLTYLSPSRFMKDFSSRGWLISVTNSVVIDDYFACFNITLSDPFSNNNVKPPLLFTTDSLDIALSYNGKHLSSYGKYVVSTSPTGKNCINDFLVATSFGQQKGELAFWRCARDDNWVVSSSLNLKTSWFNDLCIFQGEIYVVDEKGKVITFGDTKDDNNKRQAREVANLKNHFRDYYESSVKKITYYIVESKCDLGYSSSLLVIRRLLNYDSTRRVQFKTISFKVLELNVDNGKVKAVRSLGNQAIFVGSNSTFTVQACGNFGDKDCIYYTDEWVKTGGHDMGIYSLAEDRTRPFYQGRSRLAVTNTPIWVEFSTA